MRIVTLVWKGIVAVVSLKLPVVLAESENCIVIVGGSVGRPCAQVNEQLVVATALVLRSVALLEESVLEAQLSVV